MTTENQITFHVCPLTEPGAPDWVAEMNAQGEPGWMLWAMQLEQEAEEAARILAADTSDRMAGRCDMCRVWPDGDLEIDGGLALCRGCVGIEDSDG